MMDSGYKYKGIAAYVKFAIQHKKIIYFFIAALVLCGALGLSRINKEELPTFEIKMGLIAGIYPGASAEEVEQQLTIPLEETLLSYKEIRRDRLNSFSRDGICYMYADVDCPPDKKDEVWSKIRLGLQTRKLTLPEGVVAVVVLDEFASVSSLLIAIESSDKGYIELRSYAEELSSRLRKLDKTSNVSIVGSLNEEIAVTLDKDRMSAYGINPASLMLGYATSGLPVPSGTFKTSYVNAPVHIGSSVSSEREVAERIIYSDPGGKVLRMKDVATVERRCETPDNYVIFNGNPCIIVSVEMRPENNIVEFGKEVTAVLDEFVSGLPDNVKVTKVTDQPKVVRNSVYSFLRDLLISMIVVILVMVMLFPLRSALISSSGVPVCVAVTLAVMYLFKIEINTVTLAAMIACLGMIVDDSIITMDGYMDKLRRNDKPLDAACNSAKELFMPTFIATAAISLMFFPMTKIMHGYLGDFVQMFPVIVIISLMTSLLYAVSVVPSLEVKWIRPASPGEHRNFIARGQERFFSLLQRFYEKSEAVCFRHPFLTISGAVISIVLGILMSLQCQVQMIPASVRDYFAIEVEVENGHGIDHTKAYVDSLQNMLLSDSRVKSVTSFVGTSAPRFNATYHPKAPEPGIAQMLVSAVSTDAVEQLLEECESKYEHLFPECILRFKQMDFNGASASVKVTFTGNDRDSLLRFADALEEYMHTIEGDLKWINTNSDNFTSTVDIRLDSDEASRLGVNKALLSLSLASNFNGQKLTTLWEDGRKIPVRLYDESVMNGSLSFDQIGNRMVATSIPGVSVPLRQVATISPDWRLNKLERYNGRYAVSVLADMRTGRSHPVVMKKIERFVDSRLRPGFPEGTEVIYGGLSEMNAEVLPQVGWSIIAAIAVLFSFLLFHFRKVSLTALSLSMSLLCLFGASFGIWIFDLEFTMPAVLGLVTLIGIIVRNGILMFEYAEDARFVYGMDVKTAAIEAGKRRMRPIFLTSCTTALGVLPMIISGDLLWMPLGVVVCFGTMLSIFLISLVMPVMYWQLYKSADKI